MTKRRLLIYTALVVIAVALATTIFNSVFGSFLASRNSGIMPPGTSSTSSYGYGGSSYGMPMQKMAPELATDSYMSFPAPDAAPTTNVNPADRKIVKNGQLSIVVKNVGTVGKDIEKDATSVGGYVSSTNYSNSNNSEAKSGYVRLRIPVEKVTEFVDSVKKRAVKVTSENINSQDVTSEYIDLQARIKNLEVGEAQYQEFMKKATKVSEVLEVQRELTRVRGEIEQLKGQLQYLEGNSALSDITVYLALDEAELPIQPKDQWQPGNVFKQALRDLTKFAQSISYLAIYLAVMSVIWLPVLGLLYLLFKFLRKKIK